MQPREYNDVNKFEEHLESSLKRIQESKDIINKDDIMAFMRHSKRDQRSKGRMLKTLGYLKLMDREWFKKSFREVTKQDMESFVEDMIDGKIKSNRGKPYSPETRSTIFKFIKAYWRWLKPNEYGGHPVEVAWIRATVKPAEIEPLPNLMDDVIKLVDYAHTRRDKALIACFGDGGFRLTELLNVKLKDITWEEDIAIIRIRHTKTKKRNVTLHYLSEHLQAWVEEHPDNQREQFLFVTDWGGELRPMSKPTATNIVRTTAKKALGFLASPHLLRHTSATFYASRLDRSTICNRYGWSYSSNTPDRYVDISKADQKAQVRKVEQVRSSELAKENDKLQREMNLLKQQMLQMQTMHQEMEALIRSGNIRKHM